MINNVVLVGRLTRDIDLKKTQSGKSVASFTLAVNRKFGKEEQNADFILCVAWNHSADFLARYMGKGSLIGIEGRIETRNYEDKQGNRIYVTEVVCDSVQGLESKSEAQSSGTFIDAKREQRTKVSQSYQNNPNDYADLDQETFGGPTLDISSDDLPF